MSSWRATTQCGTASVASLKPRRRDAAGEPSEAGAVSTSGARDCERQRMWMGQVPSEGLAVISAVAEIATPTAELDRARGETSPIHAKLATKTVERGSRAPTN
jgi:hypothetical protein